MPEPAQYAWTVRVGPYWKSLIATSTSPASTTDALHRLILLQLRLGHTADASRVEIRFFRLDAAQTTKLQQVSIIYLLPMLDERLTFS